MFGAALDQGMDPHPDIFVAISGSDEWILTKENRRIYGGWYLVRKFDACHISVRLLSSFEQFGSERLSSFDIELDRPVRPTQDTFFHPCWCYLCLTSFM